MVEFDRTKFRNIRKLKKITQTKLSGDIGYDRKTISGWEAGLSEPNATALFQCAEAMGVRVDAFKSYVKKVEH